MQFTAEVAGKITKVCERYENRFGFSQLNNTMTPPPLLHPLSEYLSWTAILDMHCLREHSSWHNSLTSCLRADSELLT